jgi:3-hydroxypropanoate dehydrogenase
MRAPFSATSLEQLFTKAQTAHAFDGSPMSDEAMNALYDLMKWGPTAFNCQPARLVFVRSAAAKEKLKPALSPGNIPQVESASVTVIVAYDTKFFEHLPTQFPAYDAKPIFENNATAAHEAAFRNGSLQGAYLICAARALGYDCGPMSGFDAQKVNDAFFPDGRYKANFLLNIGTAKPEGIYPRGPRLSPAEAYKVL